MYQQVLSKMNNNGEKQKDEEKFQLNTVIYGDKTSVKGIAVTAM